MYSQLILAMVLGTSLASFANVLIYRLPRNINPVLPPSFCTSCHKKISWYHKFPILSWILLRGRSSCCSSRISVSYLLVECVGAIFGALACYLYGFNLAALSALLLLINLLAIAIIDWQWQIIPYSLTIGGLAIGIGLSPFNNLGLEVAVLGAIVAAGALLLVAYVVSKLVGREALGHGDIFLLALIGSYCGIEKTLGTLWVACIIGTVYVAFMKRHKIERRDKLPFGTFLSLAAALRLLLN